MIDPDGSPGRPDVPAAADLIHNNARLIRMRWLAGLAVLAGTVFGAQVVGAPLPAMSLYVLGAIILAYNALVEYASRRAGTRRPVLITTVQIAFDWLALAAFVHFTGAHPQ
jgi:hypothetical protein